MARDNRPIERSGASEPAPDETEGGDDAALWPLERRADRLRAYLDMVFVDHGFFRYAYLNLHRVADDVFRSAQPAPHHFRRIGRLGVRTVVNLRGGREIGAYALEREACARAGIAFVSLRLRSREAPTRATIEAVADLLERVEYPILVHCKSGADRAGLMSALVLLLRDGASAAEAQRQLALVYGHVRQGPTGVLDAVLEAFAEAERAAGGRLGFLDWVRRDYDPAAIQSAFRASGWARLLVDRVLGRE